MNCVYIGDRAIIPPYLGQGWPLQGFSSLVDHADLVNVASPILHAGGAISKDELLNCKRRHVYGHHRQQNPLPDVGVSYGCTNSRLLLRLACSGPEQLFTILTRMQIQKIVN